MALSLPQLTLSTQPNQFSPVYGVNYYVFTASFATPSTSALATTSKLFYDLEAINQDNGTPTTLGRFDVPIRQGNIYVIDPSNILKSQVTYPYNTAGLQNYLGTPTVVNESAGFGNPTSSFPTIAPDKDSIVAYRLHYGLQYDPQVTFTQIQSFYSVAFGGTFSLFTIPTANTFCSTGDVIVINCTSGLYSYYNGTASVLNIVTIGSTTNIITDQRYNTSFGDPLVTSGQITSVQHYFNYTNTKYAYNGVRQYNEKDIDFGNLYFMRQTATPSSPATRIFMNDWGTNANEAIPIMSGQAERARFLVDLRAGASASQYYTYQPDMRVDTFDVMGVTLSSKLNTILWQPGGTPYPQKCFTIQLFDGRMPVQEDVLYKFTLVSTIFSPSGSVIGTGDIASIWYVGIKPNTKYENVRIKFLNRQGTWCYWNFYLDKKQTSNITRTEYRKPLSYDYTINANSTTYQLSKIREQSVLGTNVNETFILNSDWITEGQYAYLAQLVTSPEVFVFYDSYTFADGTTSDCVNIPIVLTDTSYTFKTLNREKLFNLTISYKYAFDTKIQNQ